MKRGASDIQDTNRTRNRRRRRRPGVLREVQLERPPQTIPERRRARLPEPSLSELYTALEIEHPRSVPREGRLTVVDRRGHRAAVSIGDDDEGESDEGDGDGGRDNGGDGEGVGIEFPRYETSAIANLFNHMRAIGVLRTDAAGDMHFDLRGFGYWWHETLVGLFRDPVYTEEGHLQAYIRRLIPQSRRAADNIARIEIEPATNREYLLIPGTRIWDLSLSLFLYLLHYLSNRTFGHEHQVFSSEAGEFSPRSVSGTVRIDDNGLVPYDQVMQIYRNIIDSFRNFFVHRSNQEIGDMWTEDVVGSGEVYVYINGQEFRFMLSGLPGFTWAVGGVWDGVVKSILDTTFPNGGIVCTTNETDSLCMVYAIAMGIVYCAMHNFFVRRKYIDVNELSRRIDSLLLDDVENAKEIMRKIRQRSEGDFLSYIESIVDRNFSTKEICEIFQRVEDELLHPSFALDVYKMDVSALGGKRLYPSYISNRRSGKRICIVNVSSKGRNHYCLITNMREAFTKTGGKVFYTCARCHKTFYSKQMEQKHDCLNPSVKTWSWSTRNGLEDERLAAGRCEKCHLMFEDAERYELHMRHCFMKHRTGSRYVRLCKEEWLKGGGAEEKLEDRHLVFADFESMILPDGEHEMMSYGWYEVDGNRYSSGLGIANFMLELENLACQNKETHIFFHNAMNYDVNFILRYVLENKPSWSISVIMKSASRLQTVSFIFKRDEVSHKIVIGDTFHFMTMSLARIVDSIRKDDVASNLEHFPLFFDMFRRKYPHVGITAIDSILKKNLFPYRFFDNIMKIGAPYEEFKKVFEPKEENLKYFGEGVTVEDLRKNEPEYYRIVRTFDTYCARRYHDLYLMCDVMQIADVFLKARESLFETHKIDIAKYIGMPGASWAAFLKMNPEMKLPMYDETRYAEFFSYMTRGGVTSAPLRYATSDETHSIIYLDVNGLYPYVMRQYKYPMGKMEWANFGIEDHCVEFLEEGFFPMLEEEGKGACLCVDLHVPDELKFRTDQFPFAPEHKTLKDCYFDGEGEMYPFLKRWSEMNDGEEMKPFYGLVGTLYDKEKYGVHWQLLRWYIAHGLQVKKIHFAVIFDEGDYLKSYVSLNIEIRNKRTDELGKMVYKLLGNSIYGKTFESPFNRGTYLIVREADKLRGLLEEGGISSITPLEGGNCIVKLDAEEVFLDKPTYIGACVTEYAKLHMYKLFYDDLGSVFPNVELVYTDTDSFIVRVEHRAGMTPKELFQYIEEQSPGLIGSKGGQVKSETGEDVIQEVVALRSKLYAYVTKSGKIGKRAKGTTAAAQEQELSWDSYKEALFSLKAVPTHNMQFQRAGFHIKSVDLVKQSISVNDGKRYICDDGIHTHAWGF